MAETRSCRLALISKAHFPIYAGLPLGRGRSEPWTLSRRTSSPRVKESQGQDFDDEIWVETPRTPSPGTCLSPVRGA